MIGARRRTRIHKRRPWEPADFTRAEHLALVALSQGRATEDQQQLAWDWLLFAAGYDDKSFRPGGLEGQRETDFAEGKKWVGEQMIKLLKTSIDIHERETNGTTGPNPIHARNRIGGAGERGGIGRERSRAGGMAGRLARALGERRPAT